MARHVERSPEQMEVERLTAIYRGLPPKRFALAQGLIAEAARLRVRMDYLWQDLQENGETETFTQSKETDPYERERPASRIYTASNKAYQQIIKQLADMIPAETDGKSALADFLSGGDDA